jgi:hypothetical protein
MRFDLLLLAAVFAVVIGPPALLWLFGADERGGK